MAKAQKRSTKEVRKPKKTQPKTATPPGSSKSAVRLTETRNA